jgi:hypothetical protein
MKNHESCECHECTQARYRTSFQWQLDELLRSSGEVITVKPSTSTAANNFEASWNEIVRTPTV